MTSHDPFDDLEAELTALGSALDVPAPEPDGVAAAVRARLESDPAHTAPAALAPRRVPERRRPKRWQVVVAAVLAVAALTAATPQGRAAVVSVLRLAGIEVTLSTNQPSPVPHPTSLPGEHTVPPTGRAPAALGRPAQTRESDRVVSMFWPGGIRLDRIEGGISPYFFKEIGPPFPDSVRIHGTQGWWISGNHRLGYLRRADDTRIPLRLAGPTLIWGAGEVGYRLEGVTDKARAVQIAESVD